MLKKYLIKGTVVALLLLMILSGKMVYLQRSHYKAGEQYSAAENWKLAIREYDRAMHFYAPFSPYIEKSATRLWQLGDMFEKQGKPDWALIAYSSIRSSFYASRSLYTPGQQWIRKCDEKIADVNVQLLIKDGTIKPEEADAEKKRYLYVMKVDKAPDPFWSFLMATGFLGWIGSVLFFIFRGLTDNGMVNKKASLYGVVSFSITFIVWIIALVKA
jgi:hypothetical protein